MDYHYQAYSTRDSVDVGSRIYSRDYYLVLGHNPCENDTLVFFEIWDRSFIRGEL